MQFHNSIITTGITSIQIWPDCITFNYHSFVELHLCRFFKDQEWHLFPAYEPCFCVERYVVDVSFYWSLIKDYQTLFSIISALKAWIIYLKWRTFKNGIRSTLVWRPSLSKYHFWTLSLYFVTVKNEIYEVKTMDSLLQYKSNHFVWLFRSC